MIQSPIFILLNIIGLTLGIGPPRSCVGGAPPFDVKVSEICRNDATSMAGWRAAQNQQSQNVAGNFDVQRIADGVYSVIRKDPPGFMVDANSVLIINDNDVVVVDTSGSLSATKAILAVLRKLTDKPVRYVINTHWHDDHIIGDTVYRDAFPGVEFVGHARMRNTCRLKGRPIGENSLESQPLSLKPSEVFWTRIRTSTEQN